MDYGKVLKNKKRNNALIAGAMFLGATAVGIGTYFAVKARMKQQDEREILRLTYTSPEQTEEGKEITFEEAYNIACEAAKKQFGENAFVVSASDKKTVSVAINGEAHSCYTFGADKADLQDAVMKGIYCVVAANGDIYDDSEGKMVKID